jgi:hypothetical protein
LLDFLRGLWFGIIFRIIGRCFVCNRWMALHSPWALYICERTPLPIQITEKGWEALADSVAPESQAVA